MTGEPIKRLAYLIGEPIKRLAQLIGEPIKRLAQLIVEPIKLSLERFGGSGLVCRTAFRCCRRFQIRVQLMGAPVKGRRGSPCRVCRIPFKCCRHLQIRMQLPEGRTVCHAASIRSQHLQIRIKLMGAPVKGRRGIPCPGRRRAWR